MFGLSRTVVGCAWVAVLCGCAAPYFYRNTAGEVPSEQALMECARLGTRATMGILGGFEGGVLKASITRECLAMKGTPSSSEPHERRQRA